MTDIYTSEKLIESVKRRALVPNDQLTFTDEDFLEMANEEIKYFALPRLLQSDEEYLVYSIDVALEEGKQKYEIPSRAVGNKLRDVAIVDKNDSGDVRIFELSRIRLDELSDYNNSYFGDYSSVFYVENNSVVLLNDFPVTDAYVRMHFYLKPNDLVLSKNVGKITAIDTNSGLITLDNFPSNFSNLPDFDFIMAKSPNKTLAYDLTPSSINANTKSVTFTASTLPDNLKVGDYLSVSGETNVIQMPSEMHPIVAQRVAVAALEALGDTEALNTAMRRLQMMEKASNDLIDNRVEGAPLKIKPRHGTLNEALSSGYRSNRRRSTF